MKAKDQLGDDQADLDNWQVSLASLLDNSQDHVEKNERELNYLVRLLQDTAREPSPCFNQESNRSIPPWLLCVHKVVKVEGQWRSKIILCVLVKWSMEYDVITSIVLSTTGKMGCEAATFYKSMAKRILSFHGDDSLSSIICNPPVQIMN